MTAAILSFVFFFVLFGLAGFAAGVLFGAFTNRGATLRIVPWLAILLLLALLTPNPANAEGLRIEAGAGWTRYGTTDGIWYQSTYPHANDLVGKSQMIGVSGPLAPEYQHLGRTKLGWRVSLVHLGRISNWAYWEPDEAFYHPGAFPRCDVSGLSGCWHGDGSGNVWGASAGLTLERRLGPITLGVEGGSFLYRGKWTESYWSPHDAASSVMEMTETHLTPYVGVNARLGYVVIMLRGYKGVHAGLADRVLRQVIVGVSVPFGGGGGW